MTTIPYGYGSSRLTREQLEAMTTIAKLNMEFWRRSIAMFEAAAEAGVPLGPGTGWRVQPDPPPPGFAKRGNSNHEGFPANGTSGGAVAIDAVPTSSWDWMENNCARFGIRTFRNVNSEPWHIQPVDIPAGRDYRSTPWTLPKFDLPGEKKKLPTKVPKPVLKKGDKGIGVRRLINITKFFEWYPQRYADDGNDGKFGDRTVTAVKHMQRKLDVPHHGVYDRRTARALRDLYKAIARL